MSEKRETMAGSVLPFALRDRWIVTAESERYLVNVRHRTRWYAVARRKGHEDRWYRCASRPDAIGIAEILREGFREMEELERFRDLYNGLTELQRGLLIHSPARPR